MKFKILSSIATLTVCLSLAIPALAADTEATAEAAAEADLAERMKLCETEQKEGGGTLYCVAAALAAGILYEESCDAGNVVHCTKYAFNMIETDSTSGDFQPIGERLEKGCNGRVAIACTELSLHFRNGWRGKSIFASGSGLQADPKQAMEFAYRGCDLESATACHYMGVHAYTGLGMEKNAKDAVIYFSRACDFGGEADVCATRDAIKAELGE
jgi:uncharacterized protein